MRIQAIIKRIIRQFLRDKRSIALMMIAPLLVMTLLWLVLDIEDYTPAIAVTDIPEPMQGALEEQGATILEVDAHRAGTLLENDDADAYLSFENNQPELTMEGSKPTATSAVQNAVSSAVKQLNPNAPDLDVSFLHGSSDLNLFDNTGSVLIGFFVFFFVFIIGGVSFLRERTQGTLERLLATPLRRWEIVIGYLLGFGIFIIIQSIIIAAFSIYVLDIYMAGSFVSVLLMAFLLAMTALSLGTLLSAYAKNEFQMIQFIPIIIVPQVFFSGVFPIESVEWISAIGQIMPLTYGAEALKEIMIRGGGLAEVSGDIGVLIGFSAAFIILNIIALKRHRTL
ncbi:ABC-2 type transport system permease protein [Lentibacillus halodurans]|uniref:ABC-2 type transport system permease protein n=1 Tax=Lentibacillus halodurans TaxID=237679 RepID=A0A1I0ZNI5_9BACI|nr:ABC transporter permease [Lentibacillus halodurans]SFB27057.1 ABC-2 type transport system permease protein [Lentibacillus halodurans]